jgi:Arc/MetJ-type ribon-helix-helix transcriptional regulator
MGRPPLNVVATNVRLAPETLEQIDKIVGPGKRAAFIRKAVERMLEAAEISTDPDKFLR